MQLRGTPGGNAELARMVASSATPSRTPQSPGHGFVSRSPSLYAPASPGNFAPAARVANVGATPSAGVFLRVYVSLMCLRDASMFVCICLSVCACLFLPACHS